MMVTATTGMAKLTGANAVPVMSISAPPCACNSNGAHTNTTINSAPDKFVGIMLVGGGHLDAEGASTDSLGIAGCGPAPTPQNAAAVPDHHSGLDQRRLHRVAHRDLRSGRDGRSGQRCHRQGACRQGAQPKRDHRVIPLTSLP